MANNKHQGKEEPHTITEVHVDIQVCSSLRRYEGETSM